MVIYNRDGLEMLCEAVVTKAAKDYVSALRHGNKYTIAECEQFFRSEWFYVISDLDGEMLIEKLRSDIRHDG